MLPFGGVIADKYGRVMMCSLADIVGGLFLLVQVYFFYLGHVPIAALLVSQIGFGLMWGIFWPAFSGALPALLPEEELQKGNAINQFISNFALISGAAIGGYLISAYGSTTALLIDGVTFIVSGALVISFHHLTPARKETGASIRADLREGWRVFSSYSWIVVTVAGFSFVVMVWAGAQDVLGPVIALQHFHGAKSWAIVITCESIGYVVGSILGIRIKIQRPMRFLTSISFTLTIYLLALSGPLSLGVICLAAFLWGVTLDLWGSLWGTAFQRTIPREALSRASAFDGLGTMLLRPVGLAIAAPLASLFGVRQTMLIFAGLSFLVIATLLLIPAVWSMELKDSLSENS
jgi:MFS family permease